AGGKGRSAGVRQASLAAAAPALTARPGGGPRAQHPAPPADGGPLRPTTHPRLPADLAQLWLVPASDAAGRPRTPAMAQFAEAVKPEVDANYAKALPILSQPAIRETPLGAYA